MEGGRTVAKKLGAMWAAPILLALLILPVQASAEVFGPDDTTIAEKPPEVIKPPDGFKPPDGNPPGEDKPPVEKPPGGGGLSSGNAFVGGGEPFEGTGFSPVGLLTVEPCDPLVEPCDTVVSPASDAARDAASSSITATEALSGPPPEEPVALAAEAPPAAPEEEEVARTESPEEEPAPVETPRDKRPAVERQLVDTGGLSLPTLSLGTLLVAAGLLLVVSVRLGALRRG